MALKTKSEEIIDVDASSKGFTETEYEVDGKPTGIVQVIVQVLIAAVRTTTEPGGTPVAGTTGKLWPPGSIFAVVGYDDIKNFRTTRDTGSNGEIQAGFEGVP